MAKLRIVSVNVSTGKGGPKKPVAAASVGPDGLAGDAHAGTPGRQVSVLSRASVERFTAETGRPVAPGEFAENLTVDGADLREAGLLDRFRFGEVNLEVTQIGKACHGESCAIFREVGRCVMPKEGVFCRVRAGGTLRAGMEGEHLPKTWRARTITLSDRAAAGLYADRSGPRLRELLAAFFEARTWRSQIDAQLLSDEPAALAEALSAAKHAGIDVLFTAGGTGIGPRDFAPETVAAFCDRLIPGVMEHVRLKYGQSNPKALLSRSVAGAAGTMLLFALPGSVRAVEEYAAEVFAVLEHALYMVNGLDVHGEGRREC